MSVFFSFNPEYPHIAVAKFLSKSVQLLSIRLWRILRHVERETGIMRGCLSSAQLFLPYMLNFFFYLKLVFKFRTHYTFKLINFFFIFGLECCGSCFFHKHCILVFCAGHSTCWPISLLTLWYNSSLANKRLTKAFKWMHIAWLKMLNPPSVLPYEWHTKCLHAMQCAIV